MAIDPKAVDEAITWLAPGLKENLGNLQLLSLYPAERAAAVMAWPLGSRVALKQLGLSDEEGDLTELGYAVGLRLLSVADRIAYSQCWIVPELSNALRAFDLSDENVAEQTNKISSLSLGYRSVLEDLELITPDYQLSPLGIELVKYLQQK